MSYERLTQLQSRISIGTKQTLRALKNGDLSEVFIANDADEKIKQQVVELAKVLNVPCTHLDSKKKLGTACGIEVDATTVGIKQD